MHPLLALIGPTGSGKSELALRAAAAFNGEIVNCDSVQVYRGFDIGTAKLIPAAREGIPHHLIDAIDPDEVFTAGEYARLARVSIRAIAGRGRVPIVVGGTGFYLRALLEGLSPGPRRDDSLRERLLVREGRRKGSLHRILKRLDPSSARAIHANDVNKTLRALEMRLLADAPRSSLPAPDPLEGFAVVKVGLNPDRTALNTRLDLRLAAMFAQGLIGEVRALLDSGVSPTAKPFESLGYKEALRYVQGHLTLEEALQAAQQATRQYAKRQMTWFRRDDSVHWFPSFGEQVDEQQLRPFLGLQIS